MGDNADKPLSDAQYWLIEDANYIPLYADDAKAYPSFEKCWLSEGGLKEEFEN